MFDLSLDYSDEDEALLDYRQYQSMRRLTLFGRDLGWLAGALCCCCNWQEMPRRKRQALLACAAALLLMALLAVVLAVGDIAKVAVQGRLQRQGSSTEWPLCSWYSYLLPNAVIPEAYRLQLHASIEEPYEVQGRLVVQLNVTAATPCIVLHAADMTLDAVLQLETNRTGVGGVARVRSSWNAWCAPQAAVNSVSLARCAGTLQYNESSNQYIINFGQSLPQPHATILLAFNYTLGDGLSGFYRSNYIREPLPRSLVPVCRQAQSCLLPCPKPYVQAGAALLASLSYPWPS